MLKKIIMIVTIIAISSTIFAEKKEVEVRILGFVETSVDKDYDFFNEKDMLESFYGASWEVIIDHIGFGGHYGVNFENHNSFDNSKIWTMDWKGDMFVSYHILGAKRFFDPFLEIGIGNAGRTYINKEPDSYNSNYNSYVTNMSLFPYAAVGFSFNLNGLLIGSKFNFIDDGMEIPGTNFAPYDLNNISVTLFAGASL